VRSAARRIAREIAPGSDYPDAHAEAVSELADRIAGQLGMSPELRRTITVGALVHDIGKLVIDEGVLAKPGPLDAEEWRSVRRHPDEGARLLAGVLALDVLAIVRSHHERWDGTGYPDALAGESIPLPARVVAVADAYRAMLEPRPYRSPVASRDAVREIECQSGAQFDPGCVHALLDCLNAAAAA
jgi:HD-GYP domain-containing protein (c-di-GMP phosphodiesterase class II)